MPFDAATMKTPWVKYSVYAVIGFGLLWILYKSFSGSGGAVAQQGTDPALAQLQAQQNTLQAQAAAQAGNNQFQLTMLAQSDADKLALANLSSATAISEQKAQIGGTLSLANIQAKTATDTAALNASTTLALANVNAQNIQKQYDTQIALGAQENATMMNMANIQAQTSISNTATVASAQETLAAMNAATEKYITDANTGVSLAQIATAGEVATSQINAGVTVAGINATANTTIAGFNAQTAQAQIASNVQIANINSGTQQVQSANAASASKQNSDTTEAVAAVGIIAAAFF